MSQSQLFCLHAVTDCAAIRDNFVVLAARVIVKNLTCFSVLQTCVPVHIQHDYSAAMKEKSVVVCGM